MPVNNNMHHRRSIRLPGCDYSVPGMYFVTICAKNREYLFGDVADGEMRLNEFGRIVENELKKTPTIRPNIILDEYIVMPNHLHVILQIIKQYDRENESNGGRGVLQYAPAMFGQFVSSSQTIGAIIRGLKGSSTKQINLIRETPTNPVWQRNFYDHVIRNDKSLNKIRQYIKNNPFNWQNDLENNKLFQHLTEIEKDKMSKHHYMDLFV